MTRDRDAPGREPSPTADEQAERRETIEIVHESISGETRQVLRVRAPAPRARVHDTPGNSETVPAADSGHVCTYCGTPLSQAQLATIRAHAGRRYLCEGFGCRVVYWWTADELHWTPPL